MRLKPEKFEKRWLFVFVRTKSVLKNGAFRKWWRHDNHRSGRSRDYSDVIIFEKLKRPVTIPFWNSSGVRHGSVYQNNGSWQLEINRRLYLNCRYYFVGGIGIMSIMLFEFRLRDFFVLRSFSETIYASWRQKEDISRSISSTSTSVLDSISRCGSFGIAFVPQQFRAASTCCILTFSFIGGTYVLDRLEFL